MDGDWSKRQTQLSGVFRKHMNVNVAQCAWKNDGGSYQKQHLFSASIALPRHILFKDQLLSLNILCLFHCHNASDIQICYNSRTQLTNCQDGPTALEVVSWPSSELGGSVEGSGDELGARCSRNRMLTIKTLCLCFR